MHLINNDVKKNQHKNKNKTKTKKGIEKGHSVTVVVGDPVV